MPILAAFAVPHPPLIIPAVGRGEEKGIQATVDAYEEVGRRVAELDPDTLVITSPHATLYRDGFCISPGESAHGDFSSFRAPEASYRAEYDTGFVGALEEACAAEGFPAAAKGERVPELDHGTMIPLHFIQKHGANPRIVRIGLSLLAPDRHYRLGQLIQKTAAKLGRRVVFIASGDLSHKLVEDGPYGFAPEGPVFDEAACRAFREGALLDLLTLDPSLCERAAECGLRSFQIMAGALDATAIDAELLSYEGPFGVGYGVAAFTPTGEEGADESRALLGRYFEARSEELEKRRSSEDAYVKLARASLETFVREGKRIGPPANLPEELSATRAGCFVSLTIDGQLRGCIGTIEATRGSLAEEILANAVSAGTDDPRFPAVSESELDSLVYDVDVLGKPERCLTSLELDPSRYGVIVSTSDGRRGVLLPDLDGVDMPDQQIEIAARKGGIDLDADDWKLERFEVVRHL